MLDAIGALIEFLFGHPLWILLIGIVFGAIYAALRWRRSDPRPRTRPMLGCAIGWSAWAAYEWLGLGTHFFRLDAIAIFACLVLWSIVAVILIPPATPR
jgi:hypothetical protein